MITTQAIRFTNDVPAMRRFCETLGLVATVTSDHSWAVMRSGSGDVLLHGVKSAESDAVAGQTDLTFEVDDLDALATAFGDTPIDETYGRSLRITDPDGEQLWINEKQTDFYGYTEHEAAPSGELSVCPVVFTDPSGPWSTFLERLGLSCGDNAAGEPYRQFAADRGFVGLHVARPGEFEKYLVGVSGSRASLTLTTTGEPEALAKTLREAGHDVRVDTSFGTMLEITDPDGQLVQVHAAR